MGDKIYNRNVATSARVMESSDLKVYQNTFCKEQVVTTHCKP